ncbi:Dinitrogenase iron-molybdenum cofactor biosynthesis protein [Desulfovibrio sp. X2]|uniref:NifB/NifX family molybdenum-iron cluster-binding protein n=1 Tax=Desulfovibrio sp. X2 TaxID=941449 RepID=UPI0003586F2D|nr:NifB/NifX family molybdenum-iron cluster-binding protein [Desulfovibrio sp. X2]EPR42532.1 Dinitrogenase iron-molybdenum cofactor biosynthesis protein [Desulfovibrio sp. X2]
MAAAPRHTAMCHYSPAGSGGGGADQEALSPAQCLAGLEKILAESAPAADSLDHPAFPDLPEIVVAGPGDPLAEPERTLDLLEAVRGLAPAAAVRLVTSGLNLAPVLDDLKALRVSPVVVQVNAVDHDLAKSLYAWVRPGVRTLRADEAADVLLAGQEEALDLLDGAGVETEVEFLLVPGVNDAHLPVVAAFAASHGASRLSVLPARTAAVPHTETPREPTDAEMAAAVALAAKTLPAYDGRPCMAQGDADIDDSSLYDAKKPYVAVATSDGVNVDVHLGKAEKLLVYEVRQGEVALAGSRACPPRGGGDGRWEKLADVLADCRALVAASAGESPRQALLERGLPVLTGSSTVEEAVARIFGVAANMGIVRGR